MLKSKTASVTLAQSRPSRRGVSRNDYITMSRALRRRRPSRRGVSRNKQDVESVRKEAVAPPAGA